MFAKYNIFKKRRLKSLVPMIRSQFWWGQQYTHGSYTPSPNGANELEFVDLRLKLDELGCEYPDAVPGDPDWGWWIGYLKALLPIAEQGNLEDARNLVPRIEGEKQ